MRPTINKSSVSMTGLGNVSIEIHSSFRDIEEVWRQLEASCQATIYQQFDWVSSWSENVGTHARIQPRIVVGRLQDETLFLLPMGVLHRGPFNVATWLADSHTNFCMGLYSEHFLNAAHPSNFKELIDHIISQLNPVDVLELCCQPVVWENKTNPFSYLRWQESHNHAYSLQLDNDFEAVLDRKNGQRKRKKFRRQSNHTGRLGGAELLCATDEQQVDRLLDTALEQMSVRFDKAGIWNRFNDKGVSDFFRQLAKGSLGKSEPTVVLYGLEVAGKIRAVFAGGIKGKQFSGYFVSYAKDDLTHISPGDMLIYMLIEHCIQNGLEIFDFGRGEERYKTSWCDSTIPMFETLLAYSVKGQAYRSYVHAKMLAKRLIRNNELLWNLAKKLRGGLYGRV